MNYSMPWEEFHQTWSNGTRTRAGRSWKICWRNRWKRWVSLITWWLRLRLAGVNTVASVKGNCQCETAVDYQWTSARAWIIMMFIGDCERNVCFLKIAELVMLKWILRGKIFQEHELPQELSQMASKFETYIGSNCNEESKKGSYSNLIIFLLQNKNKVNRTRSDLCDWVGS